jgi:hypothetical protein
MPKNVQNNNPGGNFVSNLGVRIRLIGRLMLDRRVNFIVKLIPLASLAYLINPVDLPTPLDDIGVVWLGLTVFVELCPPEVVEEHLDALTRVVDVTGRDPADGENQVIDAEFRQVPPQEKP